MYPYNKLKDPDITPAKAGLLFLLCAIWTLTGLIGHDPWKPNEAYSFGLVYHILQSADWVVPTLAGETYIDKPPLYYWTAAVLAQAFSPLLSLHDGARLATGLYTSLTLLFTGLAGRELFGRNRGWASVILLVGCLGMLLHAHEILTDNALLTGIAMMLYGYALSLRRPWLAGVLIGLGLGIGFLSKGFFAPVLFLLISCTLLLFPAWRNRGYLTTLTVALLCASPLLTVWPWLLYQRSPELFNEWAWALNIGRWYTYIRSGDLQDAGHYLQALPWLAWPAFPIAAWGIWEARKRIWYEAPFQLLLVSFLIMFLTLSLAREINDRSALPMLLPLSLLASAALPSLRRGAANALDWFGIMTFALLALLLWLGWLGLLAYHDNLLTRRLNELHPGFTVEFELVPFLIAVTVTLLWMALVWRVGRSIRRALINWAAGITLIWILAMTLWLPMVDTGKSYRHMIDDLKAHLPSQYNCIAGIRIGDSQRAMLQYFGDLNPKKNATRVCELLLVQGDRIAKPIENEISWDKIWEGSRTGDRTERFRLYQRKK